jgi:hypothetical protein
MYWKVYRFVGSKLWLESSNSIDTTLFRTAESTGITTSDPSSEAPVMRAVRGIPES